MSIKQKFKKVIKKSNAGQIGFFYIRLLREKLCLMKSDKDFLAQLYQKRYGAPLNLKNPETYGEVCSWLKLFYRDELMVKCADKFAIREYLTEIGMEDICNEYIGVYDDARKIDFDSLPEKFVAKATHGSGWNLICKNKNELDWASEVKKMNMWLKLDLSVFGREWNYKEIKPQIIIEKFLEADPLNDYKFMCFNGEPLYMQLNNDFNGKHYLDYYKLDPWEKLPVTLATYNNSDRILPRPENYEKMYEIAKVLSKPFPFSRIDFYSFGDKIILGEITFFTGGGIKPFLPTDSGYDKLFGSLIKLPEPNHNLDLYKKINNIK